MLKVTGHPNVKNLNVQESAQTVVNSVTKLMHVNNHSSAGTAEVKVTMKKTVLILQDHVPTARKKATNSETVQNPRSLCFATTATN